MGRLATALGATGLVVTLLSGCAEEEPAPPNLGMYQQPQQTFPNQQQQPLAGNGPVQPVNMPGPIGQNPQQPGPQQPGPEQPVNLPGPDTQNPQQPGPQQPGPEQQPPNPQQPGPQQPGPQQPGPETTPWTPVCVDDPNEVVIVGDSYINYSSHRLPQDLIAESGQTWPMKAVPGSSMGSGGIAGFIPDQLRAAIAANPNITTVVMDGGGNDILLADVFKYPGSGACLTDPNSPSLPVCQEIAAFATKTATELMDWAMTQGVTEVVYFFYPHLPPAAAAGANPMLDYSLPMAKASCDNAVERTGGKMRCTFIDMIPVFEGQSRVFAGDNIHPNNAGSALMAKEIWSTMVDRCIAQPSSSGCCMAN